MKKFILILIFLSTPIMSGCASDSTQVELLRKQNKLLQEQINYKNKDQMGVIAKEQDDLFKKKAECQKYQKEIEKQFNYLASVSLFYSPSQNTCVYESTTIKDGKIISKVLGNVFSDEGFALQQNGELVFDEKIFGSNKSYSDILEILKNK